MNDHGPHGGAAAQGWFVRARVRILGTHQSASLEPLTLRVFEYGEELEMVQWGRAGQRVDRATWWTSQDVGAAHSVPGQKVEVLEVLEGHLPDPGDPQTK